MNILGKRYIFFALSLILIIPGIIMGLINGLNLSVDFTGGTLIEMSFESGRLPLPSQVLEVYTRLGIEDPQVQTTNQNTIIARSAFIDETIRNELISAIEDKFSQQVEIVRFDSVGPTIGREVAARAALAVSVAVLIVIIYITFAFRGIPHALRYGICGIIAMIHDVALVISVLVLGGYLWNWQVDALFLTALLTVIGFSVQDKIVVFDRIRENSNIYKRLPFETLVNHSIIQTLQRSINTQLMTVEFMLLALILFGGVTLREFASILLIGLFSGTYSSIFIAAPVLVVWEKQEWRTWFRRKQPEEAVV